MADDNNQEVPVTDSTEINNQETDNMEKADINAQAAGTGESVESPTDSTPPQQEPAFDPKTSYDALLEKHDQLTKNYGELRREFTRRSQHESELKKQIEAMSKAFQDATKKEISPEEFKKNLETQGIKAFDPLREQWTKELTDTHNKALEERDSEIMTLKTNFEVMKRELDTKTYPDFAKLKPLMNEIAESEQCPVDWNQDVGVIYDTLYKLARDFKAEESMKKARQLGRQEGEMQAAKEAGTSVATGGKPGTVTDPRQIKDLSKMREYFVAKLGESE